METERITTRLSAWARGLKTQIKALYLAYRDPRTPWYARALLALVVAYAFSPIDLIPDFVPVLGYLDDLVILPIGIAIAIRLVPAQVMAECRVRARTLSGREKPKNWVAGGVILIVWLAAGLGAWLWLRKHHPAIFGS